MWPSASGLGVALESPDKRTIISTGDGRFKMTCQSLPEMMQPKLNPVTFLLTNNV